MKAISKKILALVAMVAFGAVAAQAQNEKEVGSELTEQEIGMMILNDTTEVIRQILPEPVDVPVEADGFVGNDEVTGEPVTAHPGEVIRTYGHRYFWSNGGLRKSPMVDVVLPTKTDTMVVVNKQLVDRIDRAAARTQTSEKLAASTGKQRDTRWLQASLHEKTNGKIVENGVDENGWQFHPEVGWQWSEGCNALIAGLGVGYTWDMPLWVEGNVYYTRNMMYQLAENAGESYGAISGAIEGGPKINLGRRRNWMLALLLGINGTWQQTKTRASKDDYGNEYQLQSEHSVYTPELGFKLGYRLPDTGNTLAVKFVYSKKEYTYQNGENETHNAFRVSLLFDFGFHRHKVKSVVY